MTEHGTSPGPKAPATGSTAARRAPQVFDPADASLVVEPSAAATPFARPFAARTADAAALQGGRVEDGSPAAPWGATARRAYRPGWMSLLVGALAGLAGLVASLALAGLAARVLERADWIGVTGWALIGVACLASIVLVAREVFGIRRLGRLRRLRHDAEAALRSRDIAAERSVVRRLRRGLAGREDVRWAAARFAEHESGVHDPGDLLALADRELMKPLDGDARRMILSSAKRVSIVTAMSPVAMIAVGFVLYENIRMLRLLATLYGGRSGFLGGLKLGRMVVGHILATGGIALTDDLIGQFIGQDLARRLSRRLGEGLFNGALTARVGVAAVDVCRPLPFIEAQPVRFRDILSELTRRATGRPAGEGTQPKAG